MVLLLCKPWNLKWSIKMSFLWIASQKDNIVGAWMQAALQDICEYNDITEEQLVSAPETITSIEMFLYNFPHICCMSFFPNLVSLSLVQQNLLSIEGLHHCPHLELLRLSDNCIQRWMFLHMHLCCFTSFQNSICTCAATFRLFWQLIKAKWCTSFSCAGLKA